MTDEPTLNLKPVIRKPGMERPPRAEIRHAGLLLRFEFADDDPLMEDNPVEVRILPDREQLEPHVLKRVIPNSELYFAYIRAAIGTLDPTSQDDLDRFHRSAAALRQLGGPRRGHRDEFYRQILFEHEALVESGEPHPVKTLAERHHVVISAASKWITEAKRRAKEADHG